MISGTLIEKFGATNTFRAFAVAGAVVLLVFAIAQYVASLLERRKEYESLPESGDSNSEWSPNEDALPVMDKQ